MTTRNCTRYKTNELKRLSFLMACFTLFIPIISMFTSTPSIALGEFTGKQALIEQSINSYDRNRAYDLILSQELDQEAEANTHMLNLSRRIWISKRYELIDDTVAAAIELSEAAKKTENGKYQLEAMDALAYVDYYNFNNDLALKKWNTVATLAVKEKIPNELYRYYRGLALLAIDENDFENALEYYNKAIEIVSVADIKGPDGSNVEALLYSGVSEMHLLRQDYTSATIADTRALESTPMKDLENLFETHLRLADDNHLAGNLDAASLHMEEALLLKPKVSDRLMGTKFPSRIMSLKAALDFSNGDYEQSAATFYDEYMISKKGSSNIGTYVATQDTASSYETSAIEKELNLLTQLQKEQADKLAVQRDLLLAALLSIILLASLLAMKVKHLKQQNKQRDILYQLSTVDQLTQLKNRRRIIEDFESINSGSKCVALLDIDRFKQVNDTFGHATGDMVLKRIADTLKSSLRENDEVGRYGGEEFLIILDTSDLDVAKTIIERVRINIEQLEWDIPGLRTTASIGLAYSQDITGDLLLAEADKLLYSAKNSGRNMTASLQF